MKRDVICCAAALACAAAFAARPVEWKNLDKAHHLAGRMASAGYLRGKVVYVDCRDYGDKSCVEAVKQMEEAWRTFKMKPFVLIGSHRGEAGPEKIKRIAEGLGLTYPIYRDADIVRSQEQENPDADRTDFVYIVESGGRTVFRGKDYRRAYGVAASALMAMRSPQSPKQWKHYIDFDIDVLPGRAVLELEEYRKAFPKESQAYDDVWKRYTEDPEIKRLAKLERLTQQAKDYDFKDSSARRLSADKVKQAIEMFADLKASSRDVVAQEAKNCLAELTWTAATLDESGE
ncbi:MAG: hypothetical protein IJ829_07865 [Kiritimatiellae bacterium]|nr:hypothetical protein [Kiritimatiellia bacterium]